MPLLPPRPLVSSCSSAISRLSGLEAVARSRSSVSGPSDLQLDCLKQLASLTTRLPRPAISAVAPPPIDRPSLVHPPALDLARRLALPSGLSVTSMFHGLACSGFLRPSLTGTGPNAAHSSSSSLARAMLLIPLHSGNSPTSRWSCNLPRLIRLEMRGISFDLLQVFGASAVPPSRLRPSWPPLTIHPLLRHETPRIFFSRC